MRKHFASKNKVRCDKKIDNLSSDFKSSEKCEQKSVIVLSRASHDGMTACNFCKVTDPLLKVLENVRMTEDLPALKETSTPKKRAKVGDAGANKEPLLS